MADNVVLPGTGTSVAADDVGGALYQRVKIAVGADGAAADLAPGQATMANSLPVAIASNQSAVPIGAAEMKSGDGAALDVWLKSRLDYVNDSILTRRPHRNQLYDAANPVTDFGAAKTADDYNMRTAATRYFYFYQADAGYSASRIYIYNTLDVTLTVRLYDMGPTMLLPALYFYAEAGVVAATSGQLFLAPYAGGTGVVAQFKVVPYLAGPLARFAIDLSPHSGTPTTGTVSIRLVQV